MQFKFQQRLEKASMTLTAEVHTIVNGDVREVDHFNSEPSKQSC